MDLHDLINVEDIPSDAFTDDTLQPQSVSDYSSWPAESSPGPLNDDDEEEEEEEEEEEDEEVDEDDEEGEEDDGDEVEPGDELLDDDFNQYWAGHEDEDAFEFVLEGEDEQEDGELGGEHLWDLDNGFDILEDLHQHLPLSRGSVADFVAELRGHDAAHRFLVPANPHFVNRPPDFLPPFGSILPGEEPDFMAGMEPRPRQLRRFLQDHAPENAARGVRRSQDLRQPLFNMPQDASRERGGAAGQRNRRHGSRLLDELVAVEVQPARAAMRRRQSPQAQPEVIDLTGEPDSPELSRAPVIPQPHGSNASQNHGRNPRRQASLNRRTPSLSRTDSSLLGNNNNNPNFIDLTADDSPTSPPPLPQQLPHNPFHARNRHQNDRHHRQHLRRPHPASFRAQPIDLDAPDNFRASLAEVVRQANIGFGGIGGILRRFVPFQAEAEVQLLGLNMNNPIAHNAPDFNYGGNGGHHGGGAAPAPKPDHVPPPPAREGFTRNTGVADDVAICPSCEEELKYDPDADAGDAAAAPRPAKKARTRKDQEEHHFWALKECGHVYCKKCYENRNHTSKTGFREDPASKRKALCAVEGCKTHVNPKGHWVGLFV